MLAAQIASQIVSLLVLAWMMRLVAPADYGLLGMVLPVVMLPRMAATLGLFTAVLQRDLSHDELTSLFWLNVTWGLVATAATALAGLWLVEAYAQPVLSPLCLTLSGTTLLAAVANQHQALLERKFQLGPLAAARLLAQVCGGFAGIYAARRGAGLWALVAQQYAELVVLAIWVWMLEPWRPGWPTRGQSVKGLVAFSGYYSASQLVYYVAQNLDKILLPLVFGRAADTGVGLYSQAFSFMMRPVYFLTSPVTGLMVAGLSQTGGDRAAHTAIVARFFRLAAVALFPCAAGLAAVAPEVMLVLGGTPWLAAGWILTLLAPAMAAQGLANLGMHVLGAAGRSGRLLAATVALCLLLAAGGAAGIYLGRSGLLLLSANPTISAALGLAAAYTLVLVGLWFPAYMWFCLRTADVRVRDVALPLVPSLVAAVI
ncbi:MAG: oligosaccharide flippase family protein, partial [Planctomycetaceae bacterium]|nr:oligosaccharide flippase family protein [Planctomycetaceae bacterium]